MDIPAQPQAPKPVSDESEKLYKTLFETSDDAIILLNEQGFFECNAATLHMFGYRTKEEFCGKTFGAYSPPTQPDGQDSIIKSNEEIKIAQEKGKNLFEWVHRRANGEDFYAEVILKPVTVKGKMAMQATVRDITQRKRVEYTLKESEEKFSKIFYTSPYAITITRGSNGDFLEVNDAFTTITGFTREEAYANNAVALNLWVNQKDRDWVIAELKAGRPIVNKEMLFRVKNGEIISCLYSSQMLSVTHELVILSSIADITEQKKVEQALREKMEELEKINRLMVGRELTMMKLKEKLREAHISIDDV